MNTIHIEQLDRVQAGVDAEIESKEADLKQHADKLIRGFENLSNSSAIRAIWELVQNACDLSAECNVTIDYSKDGFSFTHNGKPFKSATLISLIKQVSNKDGPEVGKFGTGFISTHAFGRKFTINSLLEVQGQYLKIKDFLIDRTPKDWKPMVRNLISQENSVYSLIKEGEIDSGEKIATTFTYLPETSIEHEYISISAEDLHHYIPIVLTLNERLHSVTVIDKDQSSKTYSKASKEIIGDFYKTIINVNDTSIEILSLRDEEDDIEVVLPLSKANQAISFNDGVAKLFLYYPLIGTEQWGCNFIIHSKNFEPTETRDSIHLKSKTEQIQESEEKNRAFIKKASEMIFEFVRTNGINISDPIHLARINFNLNTDKPLLNEYFAGLKNTWINEFKKFPLVETSVGNIEASEAFFFDLELLQDDEAFNSIYALASKYWKKIPKKSLIKEWTTIVDQWNVNNLNTIKINELVLKIQETGNLGGFENIADLKIFYQYLVQHGHGELFNNFKLLPNIKGDFRQFSGLNSSVNLPDVLIGIADVIMPDIPKRHIHDEFKFNLQFTPYTRSNYTSDINDNVNKVILEKSLSKTLQANYLNKLIEYCKIAPSVESTSVPSKMMKLICKYYDQNDELIAIPTVKDDELDNRTPQRRLIRLFLNDVSKELPTWVLEKIEFLEEIISIGTSYADFDEMFQTVSVFPNQVNELWVQGSLLIDDNIPDEIKDLFDKVCKPNFPIRANLIHPKFEQYLKNKEKRTTRSLTEKIESGFSDDGEYSKINDHPHKKEILEIIKRISSEPQWAHYFPALNGKRANIMLDRVTDEKIKSDVFSILSLEADKINKVGTLAQNPDDLVQIIDLGIHALEQQNQDNADFEFKKQIGVHIERLVREKIQKDLTGFTISVDEKQGGQDMVARLSGQIVYYIEVKSRWDNQSSIRMSNAQVKKAVQHKEYYSLCCVEMSDYYPADGNRHKVSNIELIIDRIKFLNDIGGKIEPLISPAMAVEAKQDEVRLTDEYRAVVPQPVVVTGQTLNDFVNHIINYLKLEMNPTAEAVSL